MYLFVRGIGSIIASSLFLLAARDHPSFTPRLRSMPVTAFSWIPHCYPPTYRSDHIDVYQSEAQGEVKVPDPYAWLEKDGEERKRWLSSQEALARKLLDSHPDRAMLEDEIRSSTDYERVSSLTLWTQEVVCIGQSSSVYPHSETMVDGIGLITAACSRNMVCPPSLIVYYLLSLPRQFIIAQKIQSSLMVPVKKYFSTYVWNLLPNLYALHLCQPNVLSSDGSVSLSTVSYSRDGKWFAYALSRSVRYLVADAVQGNNVSVGKRLHKHLHSFH